MVNIIEKFKSFTKEDFENNRVNLHIHTQYSDGEADFADIIAQAKAKNYKVISITDHNTVAGHRVHNDEILVTGVEFDVWYKYIFLHLLAYGIDISHPDMEKFYANNKCGTEWDLVRILSKRNIKKLIDSIHNAGGIAVLAHPACCWTLNMEEFIIDLKGIGLDGLEVYYPYPRWRKFMKFISSEKIELLADKYGLIKTGGSDLHTKYLK